MKRIINILLLLLLVQTFTFAQGVGVDGVQVVNVLPDTCFNNTIADSVKLKSVPFETIAREGTKYYTVTSDGHKEEITSFINGRKRVMVKDGDGHELVIDKDGNVMGVEEYRASGGNERLLKTFNAKKDSLMSTTDNITFEKVETENYGFDKWRGEEYDRDQYPTITDNNDYRPAYIGAEKEKTIRIKVNKTKGITFKSERGVPLITNELDNTVAFNCGTTGRQAIYAYRDSTVVGKVNVQAYSYKDVKVHLVRVNDATKRLDVEAITKGVNEIFDDAVVRYTFDELDPITIEYANKQHFIHGGKGTFQNYNADQKTAIKALPETADPNDYYLFFVECYNRLDTAGNVSNDPVSGYMPVGRHYGFIYNEYTNARTIAHELAHGTNALHHTFSPESETFYTTSKTDNLMDYNAGTTLTHTQWQWSHEKHRNVLGFLDDEEESEAKSRILTDKRLRDICYSYNNQEIVNIDNKYIVPNKECRITLPIGNENEIIYFYDTKENAQKYLYDSNIFNDAKYALDYIEGPKGVTQRIDKVLSDTLNTCISVFDDSDSQDFILEIIRKIKLSQLRNKNLYLSLEKVISLSTDKLILPNNNIVEDVKLKINSADINLPLDVVTIKFDYKLIEESDSIFCFGLVDENGKYPIEISCNADCASRLRTYWNITTHDCKEIEIEKIVEKAELAVDIASDLMGDASSICNVCTRTALYFTKSDSTLFPYEGSVIKDYQSSPKRQVKGYTTNPGRAKQIKEDFDDMKSEYVDAFEEITKGSDESWQDFFIRLQEMANSGEIIIGAMMNRSFTVGHVMMITPGKMAATKNIEGYYKYEVKYAKSFYINGRDISSVPIVIECGQNIRIYNAPLYTNVDYNGATKRLKWYKYKY